MSYDWEDQRVSNPTEMVLPRDLNEGDIILREDYVGPFPIVRRYTVQRVTKRRELRQTVYKITIEGPIGYPLHERNTITVTPQRKLRREIPQ